MVGGRTIALAGVSHVGYFLELQYECLQFDQHIVYNAVSGARSGCFIRCCRCQWILDVSTVRWDIHSIAIIVQTLLGSVFNE